MPTDLRRSVPEAWLSRRNMTAAALLLLLAANMAGWVSPAMDLLGRGYVAQSNDSYLAEAETRAMETFLILSGLKAGLSVLQSSEAGISLVIEMKVQVGKVIESLVDTVDAGWKISLLSLSALYGTKILLRLTSAVSEPLLSLLLAALLVHCLAPPAWRRFRKAVWGAGGSLLVLTVAAYFLLPASVFLGSLVSRRITAPLAEASKTEIQAINQDIGGQIDAPLDVRTHVQKVLDKFRSASRRVSDRLSIMGRHVAQRIAVMFFDVFIFPMLFLLPSFFLVKSAVSHLFEHPPHPAAAPVLESAASAPLLASPPPPLTVEARPAGLLSPPLP